MTILRESNITLLSCLSLFFICCNEISPLQAKGKKKVSVASIKPEALAEFSEQPDHIQRLIRTCLSLTEEELSYTFGSNSPKNGGMDCSGTVQCALLRSGLENVPRSSFTIYQWLDSHDALQSLRKVADKDAPELQKLNPGDLVFWEGTYSAPKNDPPISHVMIFLGTLQEDGQRVLFGASSGRRYRGKKIHGVSVFDFSVPKQSSKAKLVAYGSIPGFEKKENSGEEKKSKGKLPLFFKKKEGRGLRLFRPFPKESDSNSPKDAEKEEPKKVESELEE